MKKYFCRLSHPSVYGIKLLPPNIGVVLIIILVKGSLQLLENEINDIDSSGVASSVFGWHRSLDWSGSANREYDPQKIQSKASPRQKWSHNHANWSVFNDKSHRKSGKFWEFLVIARSPGNIQKVKPKWIPFFKISLKLPNLEYNFQDEREQTMLLHGQISAAWMDEYLSWKPSAFNNTGMISIETWKIWQPSFALYNSARSNGWYLHMQVFYSLLPQRRDSRRAFRESRLL